MFFALKKKMKIIALFIFLIAAAVLIPRPARYVMNLNADKGKTKICVDAGHGRDDPGKVGVNGSKEKDINLSIALKLKGCLEKEGYEVVMTRETDTDLADADASSAKVSDLKNRVALIAREKPDLTISIHQNSYTDSAVHGAQVFYYEQSAEGKQLAETLQQVLNEDFTENGTRSAKANQSYYMLRKTPVPTVIVECGFLSNPEEAEQLNTESCQQKAAEAICKGLRQYDALGIQNDQNSQE